MRGVTADDRQRTGAHGCARLDGHAHGDEVDNLAESAGERAIQVLSDFGLMEMVNTRFGRWTDAGKRFRREVAGIRDRERIDYPGQIGLVGKSEPEN